MKQYAIGVDLGGTSIKAGLVDAQNRIVEKVSCETNLPRPEREVEQRIAGLCEKLCVQAGVSLATQVASIGIGTPGSVNAETGIVDFSENFNYRNWHLAEAMETLLRRGVHIENDANAAAYGEYIAGAARGAKCAVAITLGTGIGGGIIIDGKIFSGFNSAGAELGHTVIVKGGRPCMCGRRGCWEQYASARALTEDTRAALREAPDNIMWQYIAGDLARVDAKTAFDAMRAGDALGTRLVQDFIEYVACGVTNVINIFQPEIICIGGGVSKEGEPLRKRICEIVDQEDYARDGMKRTRIVIAQLRNNAGIIGAANLGALHATPFS